VTRQIFKGNLILIFPLLKAHLVSYKAFYHEVCMRDSIWQHKSQLLLYVCLYKYVFISFLADRTNGRAIATLFCLSVCPSVCDVMYCG